jgi:TonB family protein
MRKLLYVIISTILFAFVSTSAPYTEKQQKAKANSIGLIFNGKVSIVQIESGLDPTHNESHLWLPCVAIKFKNISNQDINDFIKVTVIFINNSNGEQIGTDSRYITTDMFVSGTNKQLRFSSSIGWKVVSNRNITAKIYVHESYNAKDKLVKTIKVNNKEFDGMIRSERTDVTNKSSQNDDTKSSKPTPAIEKELITQDEKEEKKATDEQASQEREEAERKRKEEGKIVIGITNVDGRSIGSGRLPRPEYNGKEDGTIVIDITVDPDGNVVATTIGRGTNITDPTIRKNALDAAHRAKFNKIQGSDNKSGTIIYKYSDIGNSKQNQPGNLFANSDTGTNKGTGVYGSFNLDRRGIDNGGLPRLEYNGKEEGKIVIDIIVDPDGNVVIAVIGYGTKITDPTTRKSALKAARRAKFDKIQGSNNQSGTITYNYKYI